MKTYLIRLRASALVDAESISAAEQAWIEGCERDVEIDIEGGALGIEIYDDEPEVRRLDARRANCCALDGIALVMNLHAASPTLLNTIADIVRTTGREVGGASS
jgi:hypothetical protein